MDSQAFEDYLATVQQFVIRSAQDEEIGQELAAYLTSFPTQVVDEAPYNLFFKAERAFYNGQYKLALKSYAAAKEIHTIHFFCYRATSFVLRGMDRLPEAIQFAKKALDIHPNDYVSLKILAELLNKNKQPDAAKAINTRLTDLESSQELKENPFLQTQKENHLEEEKDKKNISLRQEEIEALFSLFKEDDEISLKSSAETQSEGSLKSLTHNEEGVLSMPTKDKTQERSSPSEAYPKKPSIYSNNFDFKSLPPLSSDFDLEDDFLKGKNGENNLYPSTEWAEELDAEDTLEDFPPLIGPPLEDFYPSKWKNKKPSSHKSTDPSEMFTSSTREFSHTPGSEILKRKILLSQQRQADNMTRYVELCHHHTELQEHNHTLHLFSGWNNERKKQENHPTSFNEFPWSDLEQTSSEGYYIRWNEKGIAINPGTQFLTNFHQAGFCITDIDYVIVTRYKPSLCSGTQALYDLNYRYNQTNNELQKKNSKDRSLEPNTHIIRYYLSQQSLHYLANILKPNFKQERQTVRCLEMYMNSPDLEKIQLDQGISLHYFHTTLPTHNQEERRNQEINLPNLGIRLELETFPGKETSSGKEKISLGYVSGLPWSPPLAQHLENCDIILAGFEMTQLADCTKTKYNTACLGYYGSYSLLEEAKPQLLINSEFDSKEGDIRIEIAKKMRQDLADSQEENNTHILPGDVGLCIDLDNPSVQCSVCHDKVPQ